MLPSTPQNLAGAVPFVRFWPSPKASEPSSRRSDIGSPPNSNPIPRPLGHTKSYRIPGAFPGLLMEPSLRGDPVDPAPKVEAKPKPLGRTKSFRIPGGLPGLRIDASFAFSTTDASRRPTVKSTAGRRIGKPLKVSSLADRKQRILKNEGSVDLSSTPNMTASQEIKDNRNDFLQRWVDDQAMLRSAEAQASTSEPPKPKRPEPFTATPKPKKTVNNIPEPVVQPKQRSKFLDFLRDRSIYRNLREIGQMYTANAMAEHRAKQQAFENRLEADRRFVEFAKSVRPSDRRMAERQEQERLAWEREQERLVEERRVHERFVQEQERLAKERAARERERIEQELLRREQERHEQERLRRARERLEQERLARERERIERERLARAQAEAEARQTQAGPQCPYVVYEQNWTSLSKAGPGTFPANLMPWPVLVPVTSMDDLSFDNIKAFIAKDQRPKHAKMSLKVRAQRELLRWHTDKFLPLYADKFADEKVREDALAVAAQVTRVLVQISTGG
ncbi:hypothetical protein BKA70DRAFT_840622 [Coprinopsis sp. MPI-PUGE-AT-0042]|nr:hypothetical protein BKA70DRAFT_840622 [Coprinopsis sp. MPI-PUGE-AT-0042]